MEPRNRFQGNNSASLCSPAGRYDNPIPTRFLAAIESLKIPAHFSSRNVFWLGYTCKKMTEKEEKFCREPVTYEGKTVHVVFKYLSRTACRKEEDGEGGGGVSPTGPPHPQLTRGYFILRRRNRYSPCSAQTQTRIGLLEEIPRSGFQIPCLYYWAT